MKGLQGVTCALTGCHGVNTRSRFRRIATLRGGLTAGTAAHCAAAGHYHGGGCHQKKLFHNTIFILFTLFSANAKMLSHTFSHMAIRPSHVPVPV